MKTLAIYDNAGVIYTQITSGYTVPQGGLQFSEIDIPEGKYLKGIDVTVTPHSLIYEDIPLTDMEKVNTQMTTILKALIQ